MTERLEREKLKHSSVSYEHPSEHNGEFCARCKHFIRTRPSQCEAVRPPIAAQDWCKRFESAR